MEVEEQPKKVPKTPTNGVDGKLLLLKCIRIELGIIH